MLKNKYTLFFVFFNLSGLSCQLLSRLGYALMANRAQLSLIEISVDSQSEEEAVAL